MYDTYKYLNSNYSNRYKYCELKVKSKVSSCIIFWLILLKLMLIFIIPVLSLDLVFKCEFTNNFFCLFSFTYEGKAKRWYIFMLHYFYRYLYTLFRISSVQCLKKLNFKYLHALYTSLEKPGQAISQFPYVCLSVCLSVGKARRRVFDRFLREFGNTFFDDTFFTVLNMRERKCYRILIVVISLLGT